jgi:hypothetical protein
VSVAIRNPCAYPFVYATSVSDFVLIVV